MDREEAIRRIRAWNLDVDDLEVLGAVIPELRESEEERTRKSLIRFLTDIKEISESGRTTWAVRKEDAEMCKSFIAYLEKQKEEEGYEAIPVKSTFEYKLGFADGRDSEKQKEQKTAEWSEEDEDMLNSCISSIEEAKENRYAYKETDGDTSYDHEIAWLKSLPERFNLQPKKELSIKKAIQWLDDTFCFLDNSSGRGRDCEITTRDFDSLEEMYDSFRKAVIVDSEPHWKPSEWQMSMLLAVINDPNNAGSESCYLTLKSIYEQLKKL